MRPELIRGTVVGGRYRLEELLGRGGMGCVWKATHLVTRRAVAMKFLHPHLERRAEMCRRFLREARAASAVDHPNVVEIYDVLALDDDTPVMVMALLRGETLAKRLARDFALSLPQALEILLPVVSAVGAAHAAGVIHRDLKPENVFLVDDGGTVTVKVLDFGIAKLSIVDDAHESGGTETGTTLGTPCYMAPEQSFGERDVDHRTDIWAIGVMLYEALSGGRPVEGENLGQVLKSLLLHGITPIEAVLPDLPSDVARLVMRMLAREREDRPSDLRGVREVLSRHSSLATRGFGPPAGSAAGVGPPEVETTPDQPGRATAPRHDPTRTRTLEEGHTLPLVTHHPRGWTLAGIAGTSVLVVLALWLARARPTPGASAARAGEGREAARATAPARSPARAESATAAAFAATGAARATSPSNDEPRPEPPPRGTRAAPASAPKRLGAASVSRERATGSRAPAASSSTPSIVAIPRREGLHEEPPF